MDPADAPPGFRLVAGLLQEAKSIPAATRVSTDDETTVHAMVAAIASADAEGIPAGLPRRRPSRRLAKVFAAATFATLASTGVVAASGDLPDPIQDVVSNAAGVVGVEIPRGNAYGHLEAEKDAAKEVDKAERAEAREEKQSSKDDNGAGSSDQGDSQGQGDQVPGIAHDPELKGVDKGSCVADAASDGKSNAEQSEATCPPGGDQAPESESPAEDGEDVPKGKKPEDVPTGPEHGESVSGERSKGASAASGDHGAPAEPPKGGPS